MSRAIDVISRHYQDNKRQHVEVPEWRDENGKPLRIYWELMTLGSRQRAIAGLDGGDAELVARMARDADGKPMFDPIEDALRLRDEADGAIVTRIAEAMLGSARVTAAMVDDARKN